MTATYVQRFAQALHLITGAMPPSELVDCWAAGVERPDDLQNWVGELRFLPERCPHMLVAFLPDSDLPHLTPRECDAARKALADHLAREGYTGAKVLNACGQAYLAGSLEPVELPAYAFNPEVPPPGYGVLACFALASAVLMLCVATL